MGTQTLNKPLPFFFIGKDITTERINNYLTHKHVVLSQGINKPDTKSIWYSKDHLIKLLEEIEIAGGDGIRIQFGMYESSHEYAGQLCLVMNTTRENKIGENITHVNVVLEEEPGFADRSTFSRENPLLQGPIKSGIRDFNYGSPCPPRC